MSAPGPKGGPGRASDETSWLDEVKWDERGLVPVIAQEATTRRVLMLAWMDR